MLEKKRFQKLQLQRFLRLTKVSNLAYVDNVPECLKTEVQEVGKTDVSKVAATDVLEADKEHRLQWTLWVYELSRPYLSDILSPSTPHSFVEEIVSSKDEDMTNEDEEEFWIKYPKDKGKASNSTTLLTSKSKEKCSKSTTSKSLPTPKAREKVLAQQLSFRVAEQEREQKRKGKRKLGV
ncbi:hypothetical protein Tco_1489157 [Tanacetum coccineum]